MQTTHRRYIIDGNKRSEMNEMKDIMIKIKGSQATDESGEDTLEFVTEAKLYKRGEALYVIYEESELSGIPGCKTRLKLKNNEVQMKRFGKGAGSGSEIRFEKGKRYTGYYHTPFGPIEIEVLTNRLENTLSEHGDGQLDIDYSISLKGLMEGRNRLSITMMQQYTGAAGRCTADMPENSGIQ